MQSKDETVSSDVALFNCILVSGVLIGKVFPQLLKDHLGSRCYLGKFSGCDESAWL